MRKLPYCWLRTWMLVFCVVDTVGSTEARTQSVSTASANGFMVGVHYGVPLKWSVALAAPLPGATRDGRSFVAAEPGIGGWRAGVGYARMTSDLGRGYVARATFLRTTGRPWGAAQQSSFAGAEFQFMPLFALGARVGGFLRIGRRGERRGLLTADVSLML